MPKPNVQKANKKGNGPPQKPGGNKPGKVRSPLAPTSPKALRRQAAATMRAIYKPAFKQLGREESRMLSISEKRKADNAYYLDWLTKQSAQLTAHQDAANAALTAAGDDVASDLETGYSELRDKLVATGASQPGVISNAGEAVAFDVSGQAQRDRELVAAERQRSQDQIAASGDSSAMAQANNFAVMAAAEAKRVSDVWKGLSELGDAKQKLRLSKAADTAKEVARLFDREIQKTQVRGQISSAQAQAALEAKRFGLDLKEFGLDLEKFNFEKTESNRKYGLEKRKIRETEEYHDATTELKRAKTRQEKVEASQKITAIIQEGVSTIAANKRLHKLLENDPQKLKRHLMKILGSATAANAAVELVRTGELNSTTRADLKQLGYIIPPKWR